MRGSTGTDRLKGVGKGGNEEEVEGGGEHKTDDLEWGRGE